jgi:hypothetical protein
MKAARWVNIEMVKCLVEYRCPEEVLMYEGVGILGY